MPGTMPHHVPVIRRRIGTLRRLIALMAKEFIQFWRDPALLAIVVYSFTIDVLLAGKGITLEVRNFPVVAWDLDRTQASAKLLDKIRMPEFRFIGTVYDRQDIDRLLNDGTALMALVIPRDFSKRIHNRPPATIQVLLDGTNSNSGTIALAYLSRIVDDFSRDISGSQDNRSGSPIRIGMEPRIWFNPNMDQSWYIGLSELMSISTMITILLPAAALVREKQYGTIEQLLVSPLKPWEIMTSKLAPMTCLVVVFTYMSCRLVLEAAFGLRPAGNMWTFLAASAIYVFPMSGIGLLIATMVRNLAQTILVVLVVSLPILFLSGIWTPPEAMPEWLRLPMKASPLNYYLNIGYAVYFKGTGFEYLWRDVLALAGLGSIVFAVSIWRTRSQFG